MDRLHLLEPSTIFMEFGAGRGKGEREERGRGRGKSKGSKIMLLPLLL